jgi:hypothetical protein
VFRRRLDPALELFPFNLRAGPPVGGPCRVPCTPARKGSRIAKRNVGYDYAVQVGEKSTGYSLQAAGT